MKYLALAPLLLFAEALAADEHASRLPVELRTCVSIKRSSERLACYDGAVEALASDKPATAVAPSRESTFGLLNSETSSKSPDVRREDLLAITARIKTLGRDREGAPAFHLDNGQSWVQLSGGEMLLKVGDVVTINRAALGSFQMRMPSGRAAKVKRIG